MRAISPSREAFAGAGRPEQSRQAWIVELLNQSAHSLVNADAREGNSGKISKFTAQCLDISVLRV